MVTKRRPWAGMDPVQIITAVTNNTRLKIPKDCDPIFAQLMKQCWRHNPGQRYARRYPDILLSANMMNCA